MKQKKLKQKKTEGIIKNQIYYNTLHHLSIKISEVVGEGTILHTQLTSVGRDIEEAAHGFDYLLKELKKLKKK